MCMFPTPNQPRRRNTTGKTTLLNVLAGQVPASPNLDLTGRLFVNGRSVGGKGKGGAEHTQVGLKWGLSWLLGSGANV